MPNNDLNYIIRELQEGDCVSPFSLAGEKLRPLRQFFTRDAEQSASEYLTRTYVAVSADEAGRRILGYISIMNAEVSLRGVYSIAGKPRADRYPAQPAVRIARLAVADGLRGSGIGSDLVSLAFSLTLDRVVPHVGCRFIVVNAKQDAVKFYTRHGFVMLDTEKNIQSENPVMWIDLKLYSDADTSTEEDMEPAAMEVIAVDADQGGE